MDGKFILRLTTLIVCALLQIVPVHLGPPPPPTGGPPPGGPPPPTGGPPPGETPPPTGGPYPPHGPPEWPPRFPPELLPPYVDHISRCPKFPLPLSVNIPTFCGHKTIDVGMCTGRTCRRCKGERFCCKPRYFDSVEINCGFVQHIRRVLECGCKPCQEKKTLITGFVMVGGIPGQNIAIIHHYNEVAVTDVSGYFEFTIPHAMHERLVLNFKPAVGSSPPFVSIPKAYNLGSNARADLLIHLPPMVPSGTFVSTVGDFINMAVAGEPPVQIYIPPNCTTYPDGSLYSGTVSFSTTFFPPGDGMIPSDGPTELFARGYPPGMLDSYGMFSVHLSSAAGDRLLASKAIIELHPVSVRDEDLDNVILWTLDTETGFFEQEAMMQTTSLKRSASLLQAEISDLEQLRNLDVLVEDYCFIKIGSYRDLASRQQLVGSDIHAVYRDSNGTWRGYISMKTEPNTGACLPIPCDKTSSSIVYVYFYGDHFGTDLQAVTSNPIVPVDIGASMDSILLLDYTRQDDIIASGSQEIFRIHLPCNRSLLDKIDYTGIAGPVFADETCAFTRLSDTNHFSFYLPPPPVEEYNTIYIDEENFQESWTPHPLQWYPSPEVAHICYAKIGLITRADAPTSIASVSLNEDYEVFGYRVANTFGREYVCLEYRCSDDAENTTLGVYYIQGDSMLKPCETSEAIVDFGDEFLMATIPSDLDPSSGLYTAHAIEPNVAKRLALQRCWDGAAFAMSFTCGDVPP